MCPLGVEIPIHVTVLSVYDTMITLSWTHPQLNLSVLHYQVTNPLIIKYNGINGLCMITKILHYRGGSRRNIDYFKVEKHHHARP